MPKNRDLRGYYDKVSILSSFPFFVKEYLLVAVGFVLLAGLV